MGCTAATTRGKACKARPMQGTRFCYLHNPKIPKKAKRVAQARGGKGNALRVTKPLRAVKLKSNSDVVLLLEETVNQVLAGDMDLRAANTIGYLASHAMKALEGKREETETQDKGSVVIYLPERNPPRTKGAIKKVS